MEVSPPEATPPSAFRVRLDDAARNIEQEILQADCADTQFAQQITNAMLFSPEADLQYHLSASLQLPIPAEPDAQLLAHAGQLLLRKDLPNLHQLIPRLRTLSSPVGMAFVGWTLGLSGQFAEASRIFAQTAAVVFSDRELWERCFDCLEQVLPEEVSPGLREALCQYLAKSGRSPERVRSIAQALLLNSLKPDQPPVADTLTVSILESTVLTDFEIEDRLIGMRDRLLEQLSLRGWFRPGELRLARAIASQAFKTEYLWDVSDAHRDQVPIWEKEVAQALELLGQSRAPREEAENTVCNRIVGLAMMLPLSDLSIHDALVRFPASYWPTELKPLLEDILYGPATVRELGSLMPSITSIRKPVSQEVRTQYETHPYPQWARNELLHHARYRLQRFTSFSPELQHRLGEHPPRVLIAGCGTGLEAVSLALAMPDAKITAIDLSLNSLGYAKWMAQRSGVSNTFFAQADVLELHHWKERFDLILCTGVLHHLDQPDEGLSILRGLMDPGAILSLGMYSRRGRSEISALRDSLSELPRSSEGVRKSRRKLIEEGRVPKTVAASRDFFCMSGCRDVLYHVQEHLTSLPELGAQLQAHQLEIRELSFASEVMRDRFEAHVAPESRHDLQAWDRFEQNEPKAFAEMYHLMAQAIDSSDPLG